MHFEEALEDGRSSKVKNLGCNGVIAESLLVIEWMVLVVGGRGGVCG